MVSFHPVLEGYMAYLPVGELDFRTEHGDLDSFQSCVKCAETVTKKLS